MKKEDICNLIIIDPQNDFVDPNGSLYAGNACKKALDKIVELIISNKFDNIYITKDMHPDDHCSFESQGGKWPTHCVANTKGTEVSQVIMDILNEKNISVNNVQKDNITFFIILKEFQ